MNDDWLGMIAERLGITGTMEQLGGEFDLNVRGGTADGDVIVKVMRSGCTPDFVHMQIAAIRHAAAADGSLPLPEVLSVPGADGTFAAADETGERRIVWTQRALPGTPLGALPPPSLDVLAELGRAAGALGVALRDFDHPLLARPNKWYLPGSGWIAEYVHLLPEGRRQLVESILDDFATLLPRLEQLPRQAIHNDLNDWNVLIRQGVPSPTDTTPSPTATADATPAGAASTSTTMSTTPSVPAVPEHHTGAASTVSGLIDFGDLTRAPVVCDVAITAAYAMLTRDDAERALAAVVGGYHATCALSEDELAMVWPLVRTRLAVSVVNSTIEAAARPDDPYVTISQEPAWRLLERTDLDAARILARLRLACGHPVTPAAPAVAAWLDAGRGSFAPIIHDADVAAFPVRDLSAAGSIEPENPFGLTAEAALTSLAPSERYWIGRYGEPRLIYTGPAFVGATKTADRRTVHLGVDVFAPAGTVLHAPLDAEVITVGTEADAQGYGGLVVLRHDTPVGCCFSLWGHLAPPRTPNPSVVSEGTEHDGPARPPAGRTATDRGCAGHTAADSATAASATADGTATDATGAIPLQPGQRLVAGQAFARVGTREENGGWVPHVHLQLGLENDPDWDGVADPDDLDVQLARAPNPAALLNLADRHIAYTPINESAVLDRRRTQFAGNLALSYRQPVMFVRGWRHHLFDQWGRPYLDAYNNVPHVGHAHPRIRAVAADQLARMNSNTRYLHSAQTAFAAKLTSKTPPGLDVCFFVNSGSEANELALRLARAATGGNDMIAVDHGYHGNTTGAIDISAYKFNRPGMSGRKPWVHLIDVPDTYRGRFRGSDPARSDTPVRTGDQRPTDTATRGGEALAERYAAQVDEALAEIADGGGRLAGFICETFPSVGGQIVPPPGYLAGVYDRVRAAGGICIADEVQTGLGRLGEYYFAFEQQGVVPDIVVLGKPLGNGHPLAAVVTTREIADRFAVGPEFFSTFGGSTLSCRIGKEVLDIVDDERLQANAAAMGDRLFAGLRELQQRHAAIGDVRGIGLFVGVDLVTDRATREPATALADYAVNRLRDLRILIGREGPADNVLKIRPPLTVDAESIDEICTALDHALTEAAG